MSPSILREKLLAIQQVEFEAICSDGSLNVMESLWTEVKDFLKSNPLQQDDRRLLALLSRNHNTIASTMHGLESCLSNMLSDTRRDLAGGTVRMYPPEI
jgi:hypothetical protein